MTKRKAMSQKLRFEIFKRDSFKCQYCGASAPGVILHVDYIKPVVKGGTNEITNLITACVNCNLGKGKRSLDDKTTVDKQKDQLDELNERRLQLEMMMKWREGLSDIEESKLKYAQEKFEELASCTLTEHGIKDLRKIVKKFPLEIVLDAIEVSIQQYLEEDEKDSRSKAFSYIGRICTNKQKEQDKPYLKDLYYIRGILKNRLNYIDMHKTLSYLEGAYECGIDIERLKRIARDVRHWTDFRNTIEDIVGR